jgi:hypothetical protein
MTEIFVTLFEKLNLQVNGIAALLSLAPVLE